MNYFHKLFNVLSSPLFQFLKFNVSVFAFFLLSALSFHNSNAQNWNEVIKVVASDRDEQDFFGFAVSVSGDYAIVGAPYEKEDSSGNNTLVGAGSCIVLKRNIDDNWVQLQKLVASDRGANDKFGWSVSISGNYAVVGARGEDQDANGGNPLNDSGSAYLFKRDSNGIWNEVQKLVASDRGSGDSFGISVSISGNYVIVGAIHEDRDAYGGNPLNNAGSAYVFERSSNGNWTEVQKIVASDRGAIDYFGWRVSISANYAIVGAIREDEDVANGNTLEDAGSAYIFERDGSGIWMEVKKLVASDRNVKDNFGASVSISGNYAIVGAVSEDEDAFGSYSLEDAGSAYVFERSTSGIWSEAQKIVASDRSVHSYFGNSVSIYGDYAIVGAMFESTDASGFNFLGNAGAAYIFKHDNTSVWVQEQKLVSSDRDQFDYFGGSVSLFGDFVFVGAHYEREDTSGNNTINEAGSVYIFENSVLSSLSNNIKEASSWLYPNPTNDKIHLKSNVLQRLSKVKVYSVEGIVVLEATGAELEQGLSINNLSSGMYFLSIDGDQVHETLKFVKE